MNIPKWLSSSLSSQGADAIEAAVIEAEKKTSAEIVPMIVFRSTLSATGRRLLFWTLFAVLSLVGVSAMFATGEWRETFMEQAVSGLGFWPSHAALQMLIFVSDIILVGIMCGLSLLLARALENVSWLQRWVFPEEDMTTEAEHRAEFEFMRGDLRATKDRTGVMLFVSLLEHRAVVLADRAITEKLPASTWDDVLKDLLAAIQKGEMSRGYCEAIRSLSEKLAPMFPRATHDRNELTDRLRIR